MGDIVRQRVAARPPDVVLAYCSGVAQYAVRPPLSSFPLVVDMLDVDSLKWSALSATARVPRTWIYAREARTLAAFERALAANALATVVVTEREREALAAIAPDARLEVIPNGVDYAHLAPSAPAGSSNDVVFCGVMNYSPNADGAVWMANEVWPAVRAEVPEARLKIVGSSPSSAVLGLRSIPGVDVTGAVPDVRPYLWNGAVGIAPLQVARGVQNKVLEAVAAGLPVVITPPVAAGLPAAVTAACRTATAARDFADHVVAFLRMPPEARRAIASSVDLAPLAWEARLRPFVALLEEAATSRRRPR
jgi:sugar transferase (PEP-CTERM/EpsH1 system associated)